MKGRSHYVFNTVQNLCKNVHAWVTDVQSSEGIGTPRTIKVAYFIGLFLPVAKTDRQTSVYTVTAIRRRILGNDIYIITTRGPHAASRSSSIS